MRYRVREVLYVARETGLWWAETLRYAGQLPAAEMFLKHELQFKLPLPQPVTGNRTTDSLLLPFVLKSKVRKRFLCHLTFIS